MAGVEVDIAVWCGGCSLELLWRDSGELVIVVVDRNHLCPCVDSHM
jgi:hypothetical protein